MSTLPLPLPYLGQDLLDLGPRDGLAILHRRRVGELLRERAQHVVRLLRQEEDLLVQAGGAATRLDDRALEHRPEPAEASEDRGLAGAVVAREQ